MSSSSSVRFCQSACCLSLRLLHLLRFQEQKGRATYLGLGQQEVRVDSTKGTPSSVPTESAGRCKGDLERRPGERDDKVETPAGGGGKAHTDVTDGQGERLGRVGEGDRSLLFVSHALEMLKR